MHVLPFDEEFHGCNSAPSQACWGGVGRFNHRAKTFGVKSLPKYLSSSSDVVVSWCCFDRRFALNARFGLRRVASPRVGWLCFATLRYWPKILYVFWAVMESPRGVYLILM